MPRKIIEGEDGVRRCGWAASTEAYRTYHDEEWGMPTRDDRWIFEKLCLEGFQAGLSWLTILNKREAFRKAFANFEIEKVARFDARKIERLMKNAGIVRNRKKIESTVNNAKRAREIQKASGSLAALVWQYEPRAPERPKIVSRSPESEALGRELKKRGWSFVGPTTVHAFLQAAGMVNDHSPGCAARERCLQARRRFRVPRPREPRKVR